MNFTQKKINVLAYYQIVIGVVGILFLLLMNLKISSTLIITILGLYSFSIYTGYILLQKNLKKGMDLSILNQLIQVIGFGISGFAYEYFSGVFLTIGFNITNDTIINYNIGFNTWTINLGSNSNLFINANLVAILLMIFIFRLKNKLNIN